ncbi:hypothetical protein [Lentibacillus saliphilus]|uniref:hypothetical protein n=1 Tax=Lentibacillus saliphilus TaxID=2737028 RepID=UPI001C2F345F|nr:hypothetical protein [Lentibacillus saliphilus]
MKQLIIAVLLLIVMTLTACQSGETEGESTNNNDTLGETNEAVDDADDEADQETNDGEAEGLAIEEMPEYETITAHIDLTGLKAKTVEDNPSKRIIIFQNEAGADTYKTIYIKDTNRLKLIELDGGELYNGIID